MDFRVKQKMSPERFSKVRMIDTTADLITLAGQLRQTQAIAVDLESDSMHHYREKVCLIQLAAAGRCWVVDPLAVEDISELRPVFADPDIQKVFHGADYDVRSLHRDFQIDIQNLFDTELASRFLGIRESGLEAVLRNRFDVRLDKKFQKKDWSQRPLSAEMIAYAASDVHYLIPLAAMLQKELERKGRLPWVQEECALLSRVRSGNDTGEPLYLKFRGAGHLEPRSLAALESLLLLRERIAEKKDRPLFKIFRNESLKKIALLKSADLGVLEKEHILSRKQVHMYGDALVSAIHRALRLSDNQLPKYPKRKVSFVKQPVRKRIRAIKQWRDAKARTLGLDPALISTKTQLTAIAQRNPQRMSDLMDVAEMREWQRAAFGREIFQAIKGDGRSGEIDEQA